MQAATYTLLASGAGGRVRVSVRIVVTQCEDFDSTYNADGSCFDVRPRLLGSPLVRLTADIEGLPSPAILAIKVRADGSVEEVRLVKESNNTDFNFLAIQHARNQSYSPARKDGEPIVAWANQPFHPQPEVPAKPLSVVQLDGSGGGSDPRGR